MPTPPDLLLPEERLQIEAIRDRLQASRPKEKTDLLLCHALEDSLHGALGIDSGSFGLAPRALEDAAETLRRVAAQF